jgi:uncharacterized membrane protein YgcG
MSKYAPHRNTSSRPRATASTVCQKCLGTGHFIFECKSTRPYVSRPSRTEMLEKPELAKAREKPSVQVPEEFTSKKGTADKILETREKEREDKGKGKRKRYELLYHVVCTAQNAQQTMHAIRSKSSSSSSSSSSGSDSESSSSSGSDSGSDSDSDSGSSSHSRSSVSRSRARPRKRSRRRSYSTEDSRE